MGRQAVTTKITYIVSHPIQYQAPLLRQISKDDELDLRVIFEKNPAGAAYFDSGFRQSVKWDVPLTEGYEHISLTDTDLRSEIASADVLWLHGWGSRVLRKALGIARAEKVPVLMRGENCDLAMPDGASPRGWLKRRYIARIFKQCEAFLAIGTENKNYYLDRGVSPRQIFMTPYAIDNDWFATRACARQKHLDNLKAELGISHEKKIILFAGKFITRKGPDLLIRAIDDVDWHGETPALIFVGGGDMEEKLRTLAPDAIFTGFKNQSEMPRYYGLADVLVLPSLREPWGLVVNEAMACGTAVIASDQVGCASDLIDDTCGRVFPAGDAGALGCALVDCLKHSEAMGEAAKTKIKQWGFAEDLEGLKQAITYVRSGHDQKP